MGAGTDDDRLAEMAREWLQSTGRTFSIAGVVFESADSKTKLEHLLEMLDVVDEASRSARRALIEAMTGGN